MGVQLNWSRHYHKGGRGVVGGYRHWSGRVVLPQAWGMVVQPNRNGHLDPPLGVGWGTPEPEGSHTRPLEGDGGRDPYWGITNCLTMGVDRPCNSQPARVATTRGVQGYPTIQFSFVKPYTTRLSMIKCIYGDEGKRVAQK